MAPRPARTLSRWSKASPVLLLAACGGEYPQTTFEPVSEFGRIINSLFANTFWWTIGILVLVEVLILVFAYRYRERPGQPHPKQIHGNVKLEFLWTVIPAIIVLFIAIPTIQVIFETQSQAPEDALTVEVIGHQWWWEYRYPEYGVRTANELVVPQGRTIDLKMHSADVVHSFWVPRIGGKRDVNPQPRPKEGERGRSNHIVFTLDSTGYFMGQCAEFCGLAHAIMRTAVVGKTPAEFDEWVTSMGGAASASADTQPVTDTTGGAGSAATGAVPTSAIPSAVVQSTLTEEEERGRQLFTSRVCIACHTVKGTTAAGQLGPDLTRFGARRYVGAGARPNTLENVIAWIDNPQSVKPGALMPGAKTPGGGMAPTNLSDEEVRAIAAYLLSLK